MSRGNAEFPVMKGFLSDFSEDYGNTSEQIEVKSLGSTVRRALPIVGAGAVGMAVGHKAGRKRGSREANEKFYIQRAAKEAMPSPVEDIHEQYAKKAREEVARQYRANSDLADRMEAHYRKRAKFAEAHGGAGSKDYNDAIRRMYGDKVRKDIEAENSEKGIADYINQGFREE